MTSTATLIIASTRITAMLVLTRNVEKSPSIISTETRSGMGAATLWAEDIARSGVKTMRRCTSSIRRTLALLAMLLGVLGLRAEASATLLVEEPYGKLGRSWIGHPRLWLLTATVGIGAKHN
jgi:hypothetical protein